MKWTLLLAFAIRAVSHAQQPFLTDAVDPVERESAKVQCVVARAAPNFPRCRQSARLHGGNGPLVRHLPDQKVKLQPR